MSTHSYSRCWLHLIWETLRRKVTRLKPGENESALPGFPGALKS